MSKPPSNRTANTKEGLSFKYKVQQYDNSKYLNFVSSSKLEGITLTKVDQPLENLITKYQSVGKTQNGR